MLSSIHPSKRLPHAHSLVLSFAPTFSPPTAFHNPFHLHASLVFPLNPSNTPLNLPRSTSNPLATSPSSPRPPASTSHATLPTTPLPSNRIASNI